MIVPFPAGGPVDTLARLLAEPMRISLGQPLVVENVGGAGGSIAVARLARAEPDGYTMILGNWTSLVGTPAVYPVSFDVKNDFAPVALLAFSPLMLVGRKSLPANDVQELIAWLKANPGRPRRAPSASAARAKSAPFIFRNSPARKSSWCLIAVRRRR